MRSERIAIIGLGCRAPGAANAEAFWDVLLHGRETVGEYAGARSAVLDAFYAAAGTDQGPVTRRGGFLPDLDRFDAEFFGISPREAAFLDPQQRLLLETAWEALEDAGLPADHLAGTKTGVFTGICSNDYQVLVNACSPVSDFFALTGGSSFGAASRLAFYFDLRGPEAAVNTGCSSALVAVHLAAEALKAGQCEVALAGGANVILGPEIGQAFSRAKVLSSDGRCKFGDASADGYVRSEGAGMVVLKRLADAERDGDRIYAVIRGSAVNNNGRSSGMLVRPSQWGQEEVVRAALASAGVRGGELHYVEAHGTGTRVGDREELNALVRAIGQDGPRRVPCAIGTSKSNIGHTESAAGVLGLIKTVLALRHGVMPPTLHVTKPTGAIDWSKSGLRLQTEATPWPVAEGEPALAGVNSFGLTGNNAHMVVEQYLAGPTGESSAGATRAWLLPLSAQSPGALSALAGAYAAEILPAGAALADVCYSAAQRRSHLRQRLAVVVRSADEAASRLAAFAKGEAAPLVITGTAAELDKPLRVAFVFPGQGSQWIGMGRELLAAEPVFQAALDECDAAIQSETGRSVREQIENPALASRLSEIDVIQPTLFAIMVALARLWRSWGVEPAAVVGHSLGELAAACVAGALSIGDAARVICRRSALLRRVRGQGAMAVVELSADEAELALLGYEDRLAIGVRNSPRSTVLSGDPGTLDEVLRDLERQGVFCRRVKVDVASHSPQVDPLLDDLAKAVHQVEPRPGAVPMYSTVLNRWVDGAELDARYWVQNLREPVLFSEAVQALLADGFDAFVEISPQPILVPAIEQGITHADQSGVIALGSLRRDEPELATMLTGLAHLYVVGQRVAWEQVAPVGEFVRLPMYPWQRERFWFDPPRGYSRQADGGLTQHPVLGALTRPATGEWIWNARLSTDLLPWLKDHTVQGAVLVPGSAIVEAAVAAGRQLFGEATRVGVEKLALQEALVVPAGGLLELQTIADAQPGGVYRLRLYSRAEADAPWVQAASGVLRRGSPVELSMLAPVHEAAVRTSGDEHAAALAQLGYDFGPAFRGVRGYSVAQGRAIGEIALTEELDLSRYWMHPALLDSAFQVIRGLLAERPAQASQLLVPIGIERFETYSAVVPQGPLVVEFTLVPGEAVRGDVRLFTPAGECLAEVRGLSFRNLNEAEATAVANSLYETVWERAANGASSASSAGGVWVLIGDAGEQMASVLRAQGHSVRMWEHGGADLLSGPVQGIVDLTAINAPFDSEPEALCTGLAAVAQALAAAGSRAPFWVVTRGACAAAGASRLNMASAGLWGLSAVIANEYPEWQVTTIDLDPSSPLDAEALARELLVAGGPAQAKEQRVALRGGERYVARLRPYVPNQQGPRQAGEQFTLTQTSVGLLDTLVLQAEPRRAPGPDELEIAIDAAGLNFRDVLRALGKDDGSGGGRPAGGECAGRVVRVGSGVTAFREGDEVLALTPSFARANLFSSHAIVPAALVIPRPARLTAAEAAGLPAVYLTAYYGLVHLARMEAGERVLIHAGAGGVGLAAIRIAQWLGAEVYATAGSEEKREYLRGLGVKHVFDSRTLAFADEVLAATASRGVDIVLNSLSGAAVEEGLRTLAPYGRFVEIGKQDFLQNSKIGLAPFRRNLSYFAVDLATAVEERRALMSRLLHELAALWQDGTLPPLPVTEYPVSRAEDAFRFMAQGQHIGKLVLRMDDPAAQVTAVRRTSPVRADATYLITGGTGALGLATAQELVELGARSLVLVSRRPAASSEVVTDLLARGVAVRVVAADLSSEAEVRSLLEELDRSGLPPLRGVIHAAGILDDATVGQLARPRFDSVMAGKWHGAELLDRLTADRSLDFFVLYSSVAAVLGPAGQGNYAAANALLDALAHERAARGLPATSINWGPWAEIGLAAAQSNRGARVAEQGLLSLLPSEGRELLRRCLETAPVQIAAMHFDAGRWCASVAGAAQSTLFTNLPRTSAGAAEPTVASGTVLSRLRTAEPEAARQLLQTHLVDLLATVLRLDPARISLHQPVRQFGLDSLLGLEFRNRLERSLQLRLPATLAWNYPTLALMAEHLAGKLGLLAAAAPEDKRDAAGRLSSELDSAEAATVEVAVLGGRQ